MTEVVGLWKESLAAVNPKAAESIADPIDYPNLFDGLEGALAAEEWLKGHVLQEAPAHIYPEHALDNESDLLEHMKLLAAQTPAAAPEPPAEEAGEETFEEADGLEAELEASLGTEEPAAAAEAETDAAADL